MTEKASLDLFTNKYMHTYLLKHLKNAFLTSYIQYFELKKNVPYINETYGGERRKLFYAIKLDIWRLRERPFFTYSL